MSDREFASLQMRRNAPSTSKIEKTRLTKQINAELERRKGSATVPAGWSGRRTDQSLTPQEAAAAHKSWSKLPDVVRQHEGITGRTSGGVAEIHFSNPFRASGFYDEMVSRHLGAQFTVGDKVVRVRKPG
jgi:hypothetical protein